MNPVIVESSVNTAYGLGLSNCWEGLMEGRSAIRHLECFAQGEFISDCAAVVPDVPMDSSNRVMELIEPVIEKMRDFIVPDTSLLLATTTGQVDLLEQSVKKGSDNVESSSPVQLLNTVRKLAGARGKAKVVSCACASSTAAVARAASDIRRGRSRTALVVGCDAVSEFVYAGFSTLMAMSSQPARPFDQNRDGLTVGEAAVATLVMNPRKATKCDGEVLAEILGWGYSNDANHMTGPSRDGGGLRRAIEKALYMSGCVADDISSVHAHGTGTVYNDAMEMKALRGVFASNPVPVYSIKGGTGHTMGAAGLLEILVTAKSLREGVVPPIAGMEAPDDLGKGWVTERPGDIPKDKPALCINSGFGGINVAIVLRGC